MNLGAMVCLQCQQVGADRGQRARIVFDKGRLEALSRGAVQATFVENDPRALAAIRANLLTLQANHRAEVHPASAAKLAPRQPFDLIFADPPYGEGSGTQVVAAVADAGWLTPGGWLAIETAAAEAVDPGAWRIEAERRVGRARLTLIRG